MQHVSAITIMWRLCRPIVFGIWKKAITGAMQETLSPEQSITVLSVTPLLPATGCGAERQAMLPSAASAIPGRSCRSISAMPQPRQQQQRAIRRQQRPHPPVLTMTATAILLAKAARR